MRSIRDEVCKIIGAAYTELIHPPPYMYDHVKDPPKVYKDRKQDYITFRLIKVKEKNRRKYGK
jgi:hypothetical protein